MVGFTTTFLLLAKIGMSQAPPARQVMVRE